MIAFETCSGDVITGSALNGVTHYIMFFKVLNVVSYVCRFLYWSLLISHLPYELSGDFDIIFFIIQCTHNVIYYKVFQQIIIFQILLRTTLILSHIKIVKHVKKYISGQDIFRPLYYLTYVHSYSNAIKQYQIYQFADDTRLIAIEP